MRLVNDYKNMGGRVTVGSDPGFIYQTWGFSYIQELEMLQEAGFSPLEVIQAATINGAREIYAAARRGAAFRPGPRRHARRPRHRPRQSARQSEAALRHRPRAAEPGDAAGRAGRRRPLDDQGRHRLRRPRPARLSVERMVAEARAREGRMAAEPAAARRHAAADCVSTVPPRAAAIIDADRVDSRGRSKRRCRTSGFGVRAKASGCRASSACDCASRLAPLAGSCRRCGARESRRLNRSRSTAADQISQTAALDDANATRRRCRGASTERRPNRHHRRRARRRDSASRPTKIMESARAA